jgi:divinyl chlorophyllide a 8-vinyl-reductase
MRIVDGRIAYKGGALAVCCLLLSCSFSLAFTPTINTLQAITASNPTNSEKTVVIAGATGYIGRAVVQESVRRGYNTVALVRSLAKLQTPEGEASYADSFRGATVLECDVQNDKQVYDLLSELPPDKTIISCLASPMGTKKDAYDIDYQASLNCLRAGQATNSSHFILLSAFCCRNPLLQLQQAKLKMEAAIQQQNDLTYSIVRPTAFFKSVSGQLEALQKGAPYVLFDDGAATRCNPIAESELAEYMLNTMDHDEMKNRILNIGGPDQPLTNKDLGTMMFKAIGKTPRFVHAPTAIFDPVIQTTQFLATLFQSEALEDAAETGRIGKYYAVEDMLTTDPKEKYGKITMQDHYNEIAAKGQDPFTPVRATAVIGRVIESLPIFLTTAVPTAFAVMHPNAIGQGMDQVHVDMSLLLAELTRH